MRKTDVELWVHRIVERVISIQPVEDDRVELKRTWISAQQAARHIAAHANLMRGEPVLWVFGLDEKDGIIGVSASEFSTWHAQVVREFNEGVVPNLLAHVSVPIESVTLVALLFETDQSPYVIANPAGGSVSLEVPVRRGTATHSAKRSELMAMLAPQQSLPSLEILAVRINARITRESGHDERKVTWNGSARCYVSNRSATRTILPWHRSSFHIEIEGVMPIVQLEPDKDTVAESPGIEFSQGELIVESAGLVQFDLSGSSLVVASDLSRDMKLTLSLQPVDSSRAFIRVVNLQPRKGESDGTLKWENTNCDEWFDRPMAFVL